NSRGTHRRVRCRTSEVVHLFPGSTHSRHCPPRIYTLLKRNSIGVFGGSRKSKPRRYSFRSSLMLLAALSIATRPADQVPVRQKEGVTHGSLSLRSLDGKKLAEGESTETTHGDIVADHLDIPFSRWCWLLRAVKASIEVGISVVLINILLQIWFLRGQPC